MWHRIKRKLIAHLLKQLRSHSKFALIALLICELLYISHQQRFSSHPTPRSKCYLKSCTETKIFLALSKLCLHGAVVATAQQDNQKEYLNGHYGLITRNAAYSDKLISVNGGR